MNVASIVDGLLKAGTITGSHSSNAKKLPNVNAPSTTIASNPVSCDLCSAHSTDNKSKEVFNDTFVCMIVRIKCLDKGIVAYDHRSQILKLML